MLALAAGVHLHFAKKVALLTRERLWLRNRLCCCRRRKNPSKRKPTPGSNRNLNRANPRPSLLASLASSAAARRGCARPVRAFHFIRRMRAGYCVFHYPGKEKVATFNRTLERKLAEDDFDFHGVWFPEPVDFRDVVFNAANFGSATFSSSASFASATFNEWTSFGYATFNAYVLFSAAEFISEASFQGAKFGVRRVFRSYDLH